MSISVPLQNNGVNTADLEKLARENPQYTKLFLGLTQIDSFVKQVAERTVCDNADPNLYSIKTEINGAAYSLYLFNAERNAIVGTTWPVGNFLQLCQAKGIGIDVVHQVKKILDRFGDTDLQEGTDVNWV